MQYLPFVLIPICSLLNHLGGQSTEIPDPRIICRVLAIPLAFSLVAFFMGLPMDTVRNCTLIALGGMALWAVPGWASGFLCIPPYNDTRGLPVKWLDNIVNKILGDSATTSLTPAQAHKWGIVYFTLRGMYIYPLFCMLGFVLTSWAFLIGLGGALQGIVYGTSSLVFYAEWKFGAIIGAMLAATLLLN